MAKKYTLEDVETLRGKAGVSYEEAVALLDKYDGDITRALIELEKRGQLGAGRRPLRVSGEDARRLWQKGLDTRVIIERNGRVLADLSILFLLLMLVLGPYAFAGAAICVLISSCRVTIKTADEAPAPRPPVAEEAVEPAAAPAEPAAQAVEEGAEQGAKEAEDDEFPHITIE